MKNTIKLPRTAKPIIEWARMHPRMRVTPTDYERCIVARYLQCNGYPGAVATFGHVSQRNPLGERIAQGTTPPAVEALMRKFDKLPAFKPVSLKAALAYIEATPDA